MHDEWRVAAKGRIATFLLITFEIGTLGFREVGDVVACPLPFRLIPPNELLPLAPRRSVGRGGGAVVEDAPVHRPGITPSVRILPFGSAAIRFVLAVVNTRVDPAAGGSRAVGFEFIEVLDGRAVRRMRDEG